MCFFASGDIVSIVPTFYDGAPSRRFGGHEQRLQKRTARLMRSDLRRTASHKNWAQLRSGN
jgi:hypothetical protein